MAGRAGGTPATEVFHVPKRALVVLSGMALAAVVAAAATLPGSVEAGRIPAYHRLSPELAAAGQPSPEALASLKDLGVRTVVNLRTDLEGAATEKPIVEGQGIRYVSVPVTPDSFSAADVDAVQAVLADASAAPVLLHCASANRVGGVVAVLEARQGRSLDQALAAGKAAGLHSLAMENAVRRVLGAPLLPVPALPAGPSAPASPVAPGP
jgi:uncharacterized protein (TIGR01244 family)